MIMIHIPQGPTLCWVSGLWKPMDWLLALRAHYRRAHQPPLASPPGAHPVQDRRNDLPSSERQCTSVSVVILHPCHWPAIPAQTPVGFFQPTCCPTVQPLHRRQTGFSSFRRQLLEQSSVSRCICTVARDIQTASQDISLPPVISGLGSLTFLLLHCGPCDNFVI